MDKQNYSSSLCSTSFVTPEGNTEYTFLMSNFLYETSSVIIYSSNTAYIRANCPLLTLSKWQCDESCYSRTNDSASRNHLCSFKVSMFPFPPFENVLFLFCYSLYTLSLSLCFTFPPPYATFSFFIFSVCSPFFIYPTCSLFPFPLSFSSLCYE